MLGLFKFLFWVLLIYYIITLFTRHVLPIILSNYFSKKMKDMQNQQRTNEQEESFTSGNSTFIKKTSTKSTDDEFTDYEEVE